MKFTITNDSRVDHEFAIGNAAFHAELGSATGGHSGGHGGHSAGALPEGGDLVIVDAGKDGTLVYTMPATVPSYVCYVDNHDDAGMKGTVTYG